jgi:hypothetical protein
MLSVSEASLPLKTETLRYAHIVPMFFREGDML